jgi:hypothetical protein
MPAQLIWRQKRSRDGVFTAPAVIPEFQNIPCSFGRRCTSGAYDGRLRVGLDLAVDADAIREPAVGFGNVGRRVPRITHFDFLDEVDAVGVFGNVAARVAVRKNQAWSPAPEVSQPVKVDTRPLNH